MIFVELEIAGERQLLLSMFGDAPILTDCHFQLIQRQKLKWQKLRIRADSYRIRREPNQLINLLIN